MKVALVSKLDPADGVVVYTRQLKQRLEQDGHSVLLLHFSTDPKAEGDDVVQLPHAVRTQGYTLAAPAARALLKEKLQQFGPHIVHAQLPVSPLDFQLAKVAKEVGSALVGTYHHGWDHRPTKFGLVAQGITRSYALGMKNYDKVIVFGPKLVEELTKRGVPHDRLAQVPNGVDVNAYQPGPSPYRLQGKLRVTYMGRMTPDKNVGALVETFVAANQPNLVLTLVGAGPLWQGLVKQYEGHPGLDLRGFVSDAEGRKAIWRGTDVVVLPSPIEGLSLSLLEGMASGCMPVATDVGEHAYVLDGFGRVLDPMRIRDDLAAAWEWLGQNAGEVPSWGALARRRAVEQFSAEAHWQRLYAVYGGLVPGFAGS